MKTKVCGVCGVEKSVSDYHKRKKNGKESPRMECKDCYRAKRRQDYHKNKEVVLERNKKYYLENRARINQYRKEYDVVNEGRVKNRRHKKYKENADEVKSRRKEYYYANKEKVIQTVTNYVQKNKPKVREKQRLNHAKRKKTDAGYSILKILRSRVGTAIKKQGVKCSKTMELTGCTMPELLKHLESQFKEGMTWENYGRYGWHVDHIKPCASFDFTKEEDQRTCFHWSNLQPLWAEENLKKGAKIIY